LAAGARKRVDGLDYCNCRGELLGSRHGHHGAELGVGHREVARQVMEGDADIRFANGNRLKYIAVLDAKAAW
jgi:hypothetical protein